MDQKERRRGRLMYLLPLMLALTGFALLLLEWALRFSSMDAFSELKQLALHNWYIVVLPIILLFFYLFRIPPSGAYVGAGIAAFFFILQLIVSLMLSRTGKGAGIVNWIPAHTFFQNVLAALRQWNLNHALSLFADTLLLLTNGTAILTCLSYARIKSSNDAFLDESVPEDSNV